MADNQRDDVFTSLARIALMFLVFLAGCWVALGNSALSDYVRQVYYDSMVLYRAVGMTRSPMLEELRYSGEGVTRYKRGQAYEGLTLMQGILPDGLEVRLIDMDGNLLHSWPLDFYRIWPEPSHIREDKLPKNPHDHHSQGMLAFPDGSIIVNFAYLGAAKIDKCGQMQWTVDRMTHHFVTPAGDGNYWIGANREIDEIPDKLLFFDTERDWLKTTFQRFENMLLLVSPEGKILEEISVLQPFYDAGLEGHVFNAMSIERDDPTHLNNIEPVTPALAEKIDGVNEGDLLISIRNMNMLVIIDRDTYAIKWTFSGPWTRQHDPDITPAGNIIVFNNGRENYGFDRVQGGSLSELDPATSETRLIYPQEGQAGFYTPIFGTHQALPNGNIFLSEGVSGRLFEINPAGDVVWEYLLPYDDTYASAIEDAHRLSPDFFSVDDWNCDTTD